MSPKKLLSSTAFFPVLFVLTGMVSCAVPNLNAQDLGDQDNLFSPSDFSASETPLVQDDSAAASTKNEEERSLKELLSDIRANEKKISHLFSSIPVGFPKEQESHMQDIRDLKKYKLKLKSQLAAAAAESYRQNPADPIAARIVYSSLSNKVDGAGGASFDPVGALELADLMFKSGLQSAKQISERGDDPTAGVTYEEVAYQAFRASFALQDYARAEMMLQKIEENGTRLRPVYRQSLADAKTTWERELLIRRLEKNTDDLPQVKIETSEGDILVELFENHAPQTVGNFVNLVEQGFYNDKPFYLVRPGDCARTGCVEGDGTGDVGYQIPCEHDREQIRNHFSGTLSMHNSGRDTGSSQFFITHQRKKEYDGRYTVFGRVIEGMDVVYKLNKVDKTLYSRARGGEASKIIKATVVRKREHSYGPTRVAEKMRTARDDG